MDHIRIPWASPWVLMGLEQAAVPDPWPLRGLATALSACVHDICIAVIQDRLGRDSVWSSVPAGRSTKPRPAPGNCPRLNLCAASQQTHALPAPPTTSSQRFTCGGRRLGFVERPLVKTSPPATAGLHCAQPESRVGCCVSHAAADSRCNFGSAFRDFSGSCMCLTFRAPHKKSNRVSTPECE